MDAEEIASLIRGKLFPTDQLQPSYRSIFRVPKMLSRHNEKAFLPEVVSIGPFHHENTQLQAMGNIKLEYLKCLLFRNRTTELGCLVKAIESIEQDCYKCYAEVVDLEREEFIEMMLIDGCFILEFLCRYQQKRRGIVHEGEDDLVFKTSWMPRKIIADLLLLENQLPWCVLDCLFNLIPSFKTTDQQCSRLDDFVSFSFSEYKMFPTPNYSPQSHENHTHLLDCFRNCLLDGSCTVRRREDGANILDVKFEEGIMKIPAIVIEENTESVFRNLIAFEHCDPSKGYEITSYAALLDCLIKSPADALHLKRKHILQNIGLSNEDTARLLCNNDTSFHGFLYSDLCQNVNKICSSRWRVRAASLRRDYLGEPWAVITFLLGIIASLGLSIIQTVFAILSYKASSNK
ncbi:hypothetical protein I3843_12G040800 [Carya illinoinensis]|nr:hypothetical protein I3843_12G040800 [Carya illinoinensis]